MQDDDVHVRPGETDAAKAVRLARLVLDGSTPLFRGCKLLLGPLSRLGVHGEQPFVTVVNVESELDESPVMPDERKLWNEQSLAREDARLAAWLPQVSESVSRLAVRSSGGLARTANNCVYNNPFQRLEI